MKVKDLLKTKENWTQHAFARRANNSTISWDSGDAHSYCLTGAILRCYNCENFVKVYDRVADYIKNDCISDWNDSRGRSFEEVRELVEVLDI